MTDKNKLITEDCMIAVDDITKSFPIYQGLKKKVSRQIKALNGISFELNKNETLGLVGESGCGKTTIGRIIIRMLNPSSGSVRFRTGGTLTNLIGMKEKQLKPFRKQMAMIFQDPASSLNPRLTVKEIIADPLIVHRQVGGRQIDDRIAELLELVELKPECMKQFPQEFSGGQKQRIGIARALALNPKLIIADEPVSALDMSIQAQILTLLENLQNKLGFACLFISHDLRVVKYMSQRVAVMYLGKIVEMGSAETLFAAPSHPYTEALLSAIPVLDKESEFKTKIILKGDVPNPESTPEGCYFHPRCRYVQPRCRKLEPDLLPVPSKYNHYAACHFIDALDLNGIDG